MVLSRASAPVIRRAFPSALATLYYDRASRWDIYYQRLQAELGNTATLVDFGNQKSAGLLTASTWKGRRFHASGLAPTWTPNEALSAFDTAFNLEVNSNWLGDAPILTFNGTDERATSPDAAYWSNTLDAFSWGAWVYFTDATSSTILAKYTTTGNLREWRFHTTAADKLQFIISDEDDATTPNATLDTLADAASAQGAWLFLVATYDGSVNASGIDLYVNGAVVASTDTDDANFVSGRDTTSVVELGTADGAAFFGGKMLGGPWSPFVVQAALTAAQINNLFQGLRLGLGV